jgi:hypothetical protein
LKTGIRGNTTNPEGVDFNCHSFKQDDNVLVQQIQDNPYLARIAVADEF